MVNINLAEGNEKLNKIQEVVMDETQTVAKGKVSGFTVDTCQDSRE